MGHAESALDMSSSEGKKLIRLKDNTLYTSTSKSDDNRDNRDAFESLKHLDVGEASDGAQFGKLVFLIKNKTLAQLQEESKQNITGTSESPFFVFPDAFDASLGISEEDAEKQRILTQDGEGYRTGNIAGFLSYKDDQIIIGSRFGDKSADHFLLYLISEVFDIPYVLDWKTLSSPNGSLDFLIFMFPYRVKQAMRKGLFKQYIRRQYNDANIKGAIDIPRQIKLNTPFLGKVAYNQREFSYDNYLIELVRHTIEFIKQKPFGRNLLSCQRELVDAVIAATPRYKNQDRQRVILENRKRPVRHAYYWE